MPLKDPVQRRGRLKPALPRDGLNKAGYETIFQEKASGATKARPELDRMLAGLRTGDTVHMYKLDRLGRS